MIIAGSEAPCVILIFGVISHEEPAGRSQISAGDSGI